MKITPSSRRGLFIRRAQIFKESAVSDAKVLRIRQNLERAMINALEFLSMQLEELPPRQAGCFEILMTLHIKELGPNGDAKGEFNFERSVVQVIEEK